MSEIRIKDLPETLDVDIGDYVAVDNEGDGVRRYNLKQLVSSTSAPEFIIHVDDMLVSDKTFLEASEAIANGYVPVVIYDTRYYTLTKVTDTKMTFSVVDSYTPATIMEVVLHNGSGTTVETTTITSSSIDNWSDIPGNKITDALNDLSSDITYITNDMTTAKGDIESLDDRVTALENEGGSSGGGLTQTEKNLILTLFGKAAYAESDANAAYGQLEALWVPSEKTITYNLTDVASSNNATTIESGSGYATALSTRQGYSLNNVTVTMGGVDVTSNYYRSGSITIPRVTGNIIITATAVLSATSITATYTQSRTVYETDVLDSLKSDLVVTANYSDGTSETVTDYTLSGTLAEGTSTITVSYGGKTATFSVTVSHSALPSEYTKYDYIYKVTSGNPTPIVTDAQLTSDYSLEMEFMIPTGTTPTASAILGTRTAAYGTKEIALFITQTTGKLGYWYAGKDSSTNITISNDVVHTIKVLPVGKSTTYPSNAVIDVDGTEYDTTSNTAGQTWSAWFGIFGYATSATTASAGTQNFMRIGEIIIKDANDDVVYDFIPVSRNDNKNGFYETVNGTFYEATSMTVGNWE